MIKAKLYLSLSSIIRVKSIFWLLYLYIIKIWNNGIFVAPHKQLEFIILSCWYVVVGKIDYLKYLLVGKMVPHNIYSRIYKYVCFWKKKKKLDLQEEGVMGVWLVGLSELSVFTCPLFLCTWVGGSTHVAHTLRICDDNRECDLTSLFHVTSSLSPLSFPPLSSPLLFPTHSECPNKLSHTPFDMPSQFSTRRYTLVYFASMAFCGYLLFFVCLSQSPFSLLPPN